MTLYLLGKTILDRFEKITVQNNGVQEHYDLLHRLLQEKTPNLVLAEPISTVSSSGSAESVAWYVEAEMEPKNPTSAKQQQWLREHLSEAITTLLNAYPESTEEGKILRAAFFVQEHSDIFLAEDKIFLKNWGIKFQGKSWEEQGVYLPSMLGIGKPATEPAGQQPAMQSVSPAVAIPPILEQNISGQNPFNLKRRFFQNRSGWGARLAAAVIFFMIGFLLGLRLIYAEKPTQIAGLSINRAQELVESQKNFQKQNGDLEKEIQQLTQQLSKPPCNIQESRADPSINKEVPKALAPIQSSGQAYQGSLPDLLEKSTVFILSLQNSPDQGEAVASGSGFFVTPDTIVTNRHVVEHADPNSIFVTNKALKQIHHAHLEAVSNTSQIGGLDLAVLKVDDIPPQQPLGFTTSAEPLQDVVAAGFPGIIIRQDSSLKKLIEGDIHSIPGVILTKGEINAVQTDAEGQKIIPHSASVSPGNSGGPLVDMCGRVVGVNTFVTFDKQTSSHSNYAQKSDGIITALQAANIPIQVQAGNCQKQEQITPAEQNDSSQSSPAQPSSDSNPTNQTTQTSPSEGDQQ